MGETVTSALLYSSTASGFFILTPGERDATRLQSAAPLPPALGADLTAPTLTLQRLHFAFDQKWTCSECCVVVGLFFGAFFS